MFLEEKKMVIDKKTKEPYINVWFGNFYKPAFDDEEFVTDAVHLLKCLGFNSVLLDAKAWEDFAVRFEGGEASQFVKMREFIQKKLEHHGMSHEFLALYLNGDNLYPNIRFSPPIYGESVVNPDGSDGKWYRYWSTKAKDSMVKHVSGLMQCYTQNYVKVDINGEEKMPVCSMWDPIVAPSFDEEGRSRYLNWLKKKYNGDIENLNKNYELRADNFEDLKPEEYWFSCRYHGRDSFSEEDVKNQSPCFRIMADNKRWQSEELELYFADMQKRLKEVNPELFLCPNLTQWGYFLNVDGAMLSGVGMADLWDTAVRGIDLYRLAPFADAAHFISVPVTPAGDPDCYVTACHHNMMRNMNRGRDFIGGIYWGRFLYNDLYAWLTPEEVVASIVASGASGYSAYGMCGLDDGGVLHRMPQAFHDSLAAGNKWAKQVIPKLGSLKAAEAAILFPSAMALYESMRTENNRERRMDLLGWYKMCCDYGVAVDIVDASVLKQNDGKALNQYKILILTADDCYSADADSVLEKLIADWMNDGGVLVHGPEQELAEHVCGLHCEAHEKDGFWYKGKSGKQEKGMLTGYQFVSWNVGTDGKAIAAWLTDGKAAAAYHRRGKGAVYSFGFLYGFSYTEKIAPHVPREQKNEELYPITMLTDNPVRDILEKVLGRELVPHQGIEEVEFENGTIFVNHTSYPYLLPQRDKKWFTDMRIRDRFSGDNLLLPRTGVFIEND